MWKRVKEGKKKDRPRPLRLEKDQEEDEDEKEDKKSDSKRVASSVHSFLITIHDHAHAYTNREKRNDKGAGG